MPSSFIRVPPGIPTQTTGFQSRSIPADPGEMAPGGVHPPCLEGCCCVVQRLEGGPHIRFRHMKDKRGVGSSTGTYPGEFPTDESLAIYADDASTALGFLRGWPGVDPKRVGFHGGSQGGWTVQLAIMRHGLAAFAILVSAPATTVGQTNLWKDFSHGGGFAPTTSVAEMEAAVRADHSGYDPSPALAALQVPTLWLLGSNDRTVPTHVCAEILAGMKKPNFTVRMLPTGHGLLLAVRFPADE